MDVHEGFVGTTEAELQEAHARDLANQGAEGVHFERTWFDPESGKVFCLSSGPSKEAVLARARKVRPGRGGDLRTAHRGRVVRWWRSYRGNDGWAAGAVGDR